jgi:hypothetical protein
MKEKNLRRKARGFLIIPHAARVPAHLEFVGKKSPPEWGF